VREGIKRGDKIFCSACKKHILTALNDVPANTVISSKDFTYADGTVVPHRAKMVCQHCWILYMSISAKTKQTILGGRNV